MEIANRQAPTEAERPLLRAVERIVLAHHREDVSVQVDRKVTVIAQIARFFLRRKNLNFGIGLRHSACDIDGRETHAIHAVAPSVGVERAEHA